MANKSWMNRQGSRQGTEIYGYGKGKPIHELRFPDFVWAMARGEDRK